MEKKTITLFCYTLTLATILAAQTPQIRYPLDRSPYYSHIIFSENSNYVLTVSDKGFRVWEVASGKLLNSYYYEDISDAGIDFAPNGRSVKVAKPGFAHQLAYDWLWDVTTNRIINLDTDTEEINTSWFSMDGHKVFYEFFRYDGPNQYTSILGTYDFDVDTFSFIENFSEDSLPLNTEDRKSDFLRKEDTAALPLSVKKTMSSYGQSPDGRYILIGDRNGKLLLYDSRSGLLIRSFSSVQAQRIQAVAFNNPGQLLYKSYDGIWQFDLNNAYRNKLPAARLEKIMPITLESNKLLDKYNCDKNKRIISPDKKWEFTWAVPGPEDWDLFPSDCLPPTLVNRKTRKKIQGLSLDTLDHWVSMAAFSPDNNLLVLWWQHKGLSIVNIPESKAIHIPLQRATEIADICISQDNKLLAAVDENGYEVKLWNLKNGAELATIVLVDSADWAVTTPSGLFDASPGVMNLMYYVQGLEVIELEQLKKWYWEPGLLAQIMNNKPLRDVSAFGTLPLYPEIEAKITDNTLRVKLTERDGGIGKLSLFINDNEVVENVNPDKKTTVDIDLAQFNKFYKDTNTLALRAFIAEGWLKSRAYELSYCPAISKGNENGNSSAPTALRPAGLPHLYAIVVGTSTYTNPKLALRFPDLDAAAIAQALQAAGARLFDERVHLQLLSTAVGEKLSDKNNIKAAFESMKDRATANDILVVYFSGHGLTYGPAENSQFYYLTKDIPDADLSHPAARNSYAVSSEEITAWVKEIPAQKRVLIFDACNSGSVADAFESGGAKEFSPSQIRAYDEMKDRTGTFILAGAAADKVSFEASEYGQGLLTYSLLEGMNGLALLEDKRVDVMKLFQHARTKVPQMAKYINKVQTPMLAFPREKYSGGGESFSIGKVDTQAKMPLLKPVKPIFIKPLFVDVNAGEDGLELMQALADYFDGLTALGADAQLIYVPVDKYENGYKISGTYKIIEEEVEVSGIFKKGSLKKGDIKIKHPKNDLPGLVEAIVEQVSGMVDGR